MNGCGKDWIIKHDAVERTILVGRRTQGVQKSLGFKDRDSRAIVSTRDKLVGDTHDNPHDLVRPVSHEPGGSGGGTTG